MDEQGFRTGRFGKFYSRRQHLVALAQEGFARLAGQLARRVPKDPLAALHRTMAAYVAYGTANPEEYRLVFLSPEPADTAKKTEADMASGDHSAFAILLERVTACVEAGGLHGDVFRIGTLLWTGMHGVTSLLITFPSFPFGERRRYVEAMIETLLAGLTPPRP